MKSRNWRPLIGVTTSVKGGMLSWLFNRFAVWRAGGRAVRISAGSPVFYDRLDGLIVGGGDDINAELYEGDIELNIRVDHRRDQLEQSLLVRSEKTPLPVLGICRGAQMINIHHHGTLHEDMYRIYETAPRMRTVLPRKKVNIESGSRLFQIMKKKRHRINCLHHQSINRVGKDLQVAAKDDHEIIQAIENPDHPFLVGVQWHPEYLPLSQIHQRLFRALVKKAREYAVKKFHHPGSVGCLRKPGNEQTRFPLEAFFLT